MAITASQTDSQSPIDQTLMDAIRLASIIILANPPVELLDDSTPATSYTDITVSPAAGKTPTMALISVRGVAAVTGAGGDLTANVYFRANGDTAWTDALALRMVLKGLTTTSAIASSNGMFLVPLDESYIFEYKTSIANGSWSVFKVHLLGYL